MNINIDTKPSIAFKLEAMEQDKLIGWVYLYIIKNDLHEQPYGLMENLFINEDFRGKGMGGGLVDALIELAKKQGCYKLIGTSRESNLVAHKLYEKKGFQKHGLEFRMDL